MSDKSYGYSAFQSHNACCVVALPQQAIGRRLPCSPIPIPAWYQLVWAWANSACFASNTLNQIAPQGDCNVCINRYIGISLILHFYYYVINPIHCIISLDITSSLCFLCDIASRKSAPIPGPPKKPGTFYTDCPMIWNVFSTYLISHNGCWP